MALYVMTIVYDLVKIVRSVMEWHVLIKPMSERLLKVVAGLYAIGVAAKFSLFGPRLLRWYVSDIGFPVMLLLAFTAIMSGSARSGYRKAKSETEYLELKLKATVSRFKLLAFALILSLKYELFTGWLIPRAKNTGVQDGDIGEFDWLDILCYLIGSAIAAVILFHQRWIDKLLLDSSRAKDVTKAEEAKQLTEIKRQRASESRKTSTRRRRGRK